MKLHQIDKFSSNNYGVQYEYIRPSLDINSFYAHVDITKLVSSHNGSKMVWLLEGNLEICVCTQLIPLLGYYLKKIVQNMREKAVPTNICIASLLYTSK